MRQFISYRIVANAIVLIRWVLCVIVNFREKEACKTLIEHIFLFSVLIVAALTFTSYAMVPISDGPYRALYSRGIQLWAFLIHIVQLLWTPFRFIPTVSFIILGVALISENEIDWVPRTYEMKELTPNAKF